MSEPIKNEKFENAVRKMSHELRTPLTSIMGFSELLLEEEHLTGQSREYLTIISKESRKLSEMINHYLAVLLVEGSAFGSTEPTDSLPAAERPL